MIATRRAGAGVTDSPASLVRVTISRCTASSSSVVAVPASRLSPTSWEYWPTFRSCTWTTSSGTPAWHPCRPRRGLPHRRSSHSGGPGSLTEISAPTTYSTCGCARRTPSFCSTSRSLGAPGEPSAGPAGAPTSGCGSGATGAVGGRGSSVPCRPSHRTPRSTSCARRVRSAGSSPICAAIEVERVAGVAPDHDRAAAADFGPTVRAPHRQRRHAPCSCGSGRTPRRWRGGSPQADSPVPDWGTVVPNALVLAIRQAACWMTTEPSRLSRVPIPLRRDVPGACALSGGGVQRLVQGAGG